MIDKCQFVRLICYAFLIGVLSACCFLILIAGQSGTRCKCPYQQTSGPEITPARCFIDAIALGIQSGL